VFTNSSDRPVHAREFDDQERKQSLASDESLNRVLPLSRMARASKNTGVGGMVVMQDGPMLVTALPVLNAVGHRAHHGALLMGRRLNAGELKRLAWTTSLQFDIFSLADARLPRDVAHAHAQLSRSSAVVSPLGQGIAGYTLLKDYTRKPALVLRVQTPRVVYAQGKMTLLYLMGFTLFVGVVFTILTLFLLEKQVLSRLISLSRSVAAIGVRSGLSARVRVQGADEISHLAGSINQMLASLERAEREVPEAYLEGLFESAPEAVVIVDSQRRVVR